MDEIWEDFNAAEAAYAARHEAELAEDIAAESLVEQIADMYDLQPESVATVLMTVSQLTQGDDED